MIITSLDVYKEGGPWLGAVRKWMQCNIKNGEHITFDSDEKITITVKELEEAASYAVAADRRNRLK